MKKSLPRMLKVILPLLGLATLGGVIGVVATACSNQTTSSASGSSGTDKDILGSGNLKSSGDMYQNNLVNANLQGNKGYVFQQNAHNNVNIAALANIINYNEIQYMYNVLNNPAMKQFMNWLSTKKVLVVDGQIPNPSWSRVSTDSPGNKSAQMENIQQQFVICSPQLYPLLYTSPTNKEMPGFGMQMALPTSKDNLNTVLSDWKGAIIAGNKGQPQTQLFNALKGSADIVLYVYPGTSNWISQNLSMAQEALKPLLTTDSQNYYQDAVIPVTLSQGFDSLNSPIGLIYLMQSLINGQAYQQTTDGVWSKDDSQDWITSLGKFYEAVNPNDKNFATYNQTITPYFELRETFGMDLSDYGYSEKGKKAVFPFAEKYIHTLWDNKAEGDRTKTLAAYFNDTSMLLALGFTPYYSTYIIDPGQSAVPSLKEGVVLPAYIKSAYPNLIGSEKDHKDGQTIPLTQQTTGIWQHHVEPVVQNLYIKHIGTVLADDWLMPKTATIYSSGRPVVNHIIYNTQGDYTLNGEAFFTADNKSANFNSTSATPSNISNSGFMPSNLMNQSINGKSFFDVLKNCSTTGIDGELGNAIMDDFQGFQWFANQIQYIHVNEFQTPKLTYYYDSKILNFKDVDLSFIDWNIAPELLTNNSSSVINNVADSVSTKK